MPYLRTIMVVVADCVPQQFWRAEMRQEVNANLGKVLWTVANDGNIHLYRVDTFCRPVR
jgi:hypothetical protein